MKKQKIVDAVIEDMKKSFEQGDYTVLEEVLFMVSKQKLIQCLPEEDWPKYTKKKSTDETDMWNNLSQGLGRF